MSYAPATAGDAAFVFARALSVRQPWAWFIAHGFKPVENRDWKTWNPGLKYRGHVLIHAAKGMTRDEYDFGREMAWHVDRVAWELMPSFDALERGGIVGRGVITAAVTSHPSPWFCGPYGLVIEDAGPVGFAPCRGALGFFTPDIQGPLVILPRITDGGTV